MGKTEALWGKEKISDTGTVFSQFFKTSEKLLKKRLVLC